MQGSLGEKIGEGAFSEAYAWAPGQVVKLFKPGVSRLMLRHEARMLRAVHAAGVPVPEVFGEVTLDGRFGIVLQRLDGPTLWQLSRTGAVTFEQAARSSRLWQCLFTRRPRRRRSSPCASIWRGSCGTTTARSRSTSPRIFSP